MAQQQETEVDTDKDIVELCMKKILSASESADDVFEITAQVVVNISNFMACHDSEYDEGEDTHFACLTKAIEQIGEKVNETINTSDDVKVLKEHCADMHKHNVRNSNTVQ